MLTTRLTEHGFHPVWSPRGDAIAFEATVDGEAWIQVVPAGGGKIRRLARGDHPRWLPDGSAIVYEADRDGAGTDLFLFDLASGGERRLTAEPGDEGGAVPSPDGARIAYLARRDGDWRLRVLDLATGRVTAAPASPGAQLAPTWSPVGDAAILMVRAVDDWDLVRLDLAARTLEPVATGIGDQTTPAWRRDGGFVFLEHVGGSTTLRLHAAAGDRVLAATDEDLSWIAVSPEGSRVAFTVGSGATNRIDVVDVASGAVSTLVAPKGRNVALDWAPDGEALAFASDRQGAFAIYTVAVGGPPE